MFGVVLVLWLGVGEVVVFFLVDGYMLLFVVMLLVLLYKMVVKVLVIC